MPTGVYPCPGEQAVQDQNMGENRVQRELQLSIMVGGWGGSQDAEG